VLCVDDEDFFLEGIRRLLERRGQPVVIAHNGREAMEILENGAAAVCEALVTDLRMPEVSGDELILLVKEKYPNLGIVVLSGEVMEEDELAWRERGVAEVLRKPVSIKKLENAIRSAARPR